MATKRKRTPSPDAGTIKEEDDIAQSTPIDDRSSRFIGFYSPTIPPKQLQQFVGLGGADHKILGWRRESNQQSLTKTKQYVTGHDDDGEQYGGKKVENVLKNMNVVGACVVARWWGGILLGPVRFEHIENSARDAVKKWQEHEDEKKAKARKLEEEAREKPRVIEVLIQRDQSIAVLRTLAAEKEAAIEKHRDTLAATEETTTVKNIDHATQPSKRAEVTSKPDSSVASPKSSPDYESMSFARLQSLEKARDATLSFLLKRIDKAEAQLRKYPASQA